MKAKYKEYVFAANTEGSHKAGSYVRALDLLDPILREKTGFLEGVSDIWHLNSVTKVLDVYKFVLEHQKKTDGGVFKDSVNPSYWERRFYSGALKSYAQFLVLNARDDEMQLCIDKAKSAEEMAASLEKVELKETEIFLGRIDPESREGKDVIREVKKRQNQEVFRRYILQIYKSTCCVTGLQVPEVLRASHIIPWEENKKTRLNPENGLCLSATYDAAFDRNLISFDEDYRMILSKSLKEHYTSKVFHEYFTNFEGKRITLPIKYLPSQKFLGVHRDRMDAV